MEMAMMPHYGQIDLKNVAFIQNGILFSHKE
jgi:hypothetical protein